MKTLIFILSLWSATIMMGQNIPSERLVDWSSAGRSNDIISPDTVINIMDYGGIADGTSSNHNALTAAKNALAGMPGIIYFPPGEYLFNQKINLTTGLIIKGHGSDSTTLLFDLNGNNHCIDVNGSRSQNNVYSMANICRGQFHIKVQDTAGLVAGNYFMLLAKDDSLVNDAWAHGSVGQINRITEIKSDRILVEHAIRKNYMLADSPYIEIINPQKHIGIECLKLKRLDVTTSQTAHIRFNLAAECWVSAVESERCNYAHVILQRATKCSISGSYFHHAFSYGSGGKAYGVVLQFTSGDNLIENSVFEHLRHSMLLQAGVNGNVLAYNYSTDPFKTEFGFLTNVTGDLVCHGNYVFANLFEGNLASYGIVDASHGGNGPFNTYFRNRLSLYGMQISNSSPDNNSQNIIGNDITGLSISESDHFQFGNNDEGIIIPPATDTLTINSLFTDEAPSYFDTLPWPSIGFPHPYNVGTIPAKVRFESVDQIVSPCPTHDICPASITVDDIAYTSPIYQAEAQVNTSANVYPYQQVILHAGQHIELEAGFHVRIGAEFEAVIENCQ